MNGMPRTGMPLRRPAGCSSVRWTVHPRYVRLKFVCVKANVVKPRYWSGHRRALKTNPRCRENPRYRAVCMFNYAFRQPLRPILMRQNIAVRPEPRCRLGDFIKYVRSFRCRPQLITSARTSGFCDCLLILFQPNVVSMFSRGTMIGLQIARSDRFSSWKRDAFCTHFAWLIVTLSHGMLP